MSGELPAPAPRVTPETAPYWEGTLRGELWLPRCTACGLYIWYPKTLCSDCSSLDVSWERATGTGTIYSYTVMRGRRAAGPYASAVPYVLAFVELDEGPKVMTNITGCDPADVRIGQRVEAVFTPTGGEGALLRFRPAAGQGTG